MYARTNRGGAVKFNYETAFVRNIGWITADEQSILQSKRVAIAGLGGVGGRHLLALTRLGIGHFTISDMDSFELPNLNRQAGATSSALGKEKVDVLAGIAVDINPEVDLRVFASGVNTDNVHEFLNGADVYVDGLDYFAISVRRRVFACCAELGVPAITAAPLGMGASLLCFLPGKMSFEDYFQLDGKSTEEQLIRFLIGLSPAMLQRSYLADRNTVNFAEHRGPSTVMACDLCAGMAATAVLKVLLGRGRIIAAPMVQHFDAFRNRYVKTWRPKGNANPLQRLTLAIVERQLRKQHTLKN